MPPRFDTGPQAIDKYAQTDTVTHTPPLLGDLGLNYSAKN